MVADESLGLWDSWIGTTGEKWLASDHVLERRSRPVAPGGRSPVRSDGSPMLACGCAGLTSSFQVKPR